MAKSEAEAKLEEMKAAFPEEDIFALADPGGTFEGVFRAPTPEAWKMFQTERRAGPQTEAIAPQNLVTRCLLWPAADVLRACARRRAALYDSVLAPEIAAAAGARTDATVKR